MNTKSYFTSMFASTCTRILYLSLLIHYFCFLINTLPQAELREHDHVVECITWCEGNACTAVNDALATDNRKPTYQGPFLISGSRDKTIRV